MFTLFTLDPLRLAHDLANIQPKYLPAFENHSSVYDAPVNNRLPTRITGSISDNHSGVSTISVLISESYFEHSERTGLHIRELDNHFTSTRTPSREEISLSTEREKDQNLFKHESFDKSQNELLSTGDTSEKFEQTEINRVDSPLRRSRSVKRNFDKNRSRLRSHRRSRSTLKERNLNVPRSDASYDNECLSTHSLLRKGKNRVHSRQKGTRLPDKERTDRDLCRVCTSFVSSELRPSSKRFRSRMYEWTNRERLKYCPY